MLGSFFLMCSSPFGKLALDPGDIEKDAAVRTPSPSFDLAHDAARNVITGQQLRRAARILVALAIAPAFLFVVGRLRSVILGNVVKHETAAFLVRQDAAFAPHAFSYENARARSAARPSRWDGIG